jgi:retron-type reverse transcriptase
MKRHGNLWGRLTSFENLLVAFRQAAKGKGCKLYVLLFIKKLEHNLLRIQDELLTERYKPGAYTTFPIYEPKKRMISAAPFEDRVVHHALINVIGPLFEASFIPQSYANQVGKGTHRAIREVQSAMRLHRYVLHCDVRKYFPSIDLEILKGLIRRKIKDPGVLRLVDLIVDGSNPQERIVQYFPGDNLFTPLERRRGLPIGNLTSQFFANVYLNGFDHFVKEELGCRFYARYVDDIVVVESDKDHLWAVCAAMERYLEKLRLRMHPNKRHIRPVESGFRFLGQVIYPDRRRLPKENLRRFMRRMREFRRRYAAGEVTLDEIRQSLLSWQGHAKQANTCSLRRSLYKEIRIGEDV